MEKTNVFKGKLGFDGTLENALSRATPILIDTLEDFGHDVETFAARTASAVNMDLDQYTVELRYRKQMKRGWDAPQSKGDMLELRLTPLFPEVCDQELSEMLLAALLQKLVLELEPASIKWLSTPVLLTRNQFLSAFDPLDSAAFAIPEEARVPEFMPGAPMVPAQDAEDFADVSEPAEVEMDAEDLLDAAFERKAQGFAEVLPPEPSLPPRRRGRSVFDPVDETASTLADHCDEILMASYEVLDEEPAYRTAAKASASAQPARFDLKRVMSFAMAGSFKQGSRAAQFRTSLMALLLTAFALYLDSAGMVRAAISLLQ